MTTPRQLQLENAEGDVQTVVVGEGHGNSGEISALLANGYDFSESSRDQNISLLTRNDEGAQVVENIPAGNVRSYMDAMQQAVGQRPMIATGDSGVQDYIGNMRRDLERAQRVRELSESWEGAALGLASGAASPFLAVARLSDAATGGGFESSNNFFTGLSEVSEARPGMQMLGNLAMMIGTGGAGAIQGLSVGAASAVARGAAQAGVRASASRALQLGAGVAVEEALWAADAMSLEMMRENPNLSGEALVGGALFGAGVGLVVGPHLRAFRRARAAESAPIPSRLAAADSSRLYPGAEGMSIIEMARNPPMHEVSTLGLRPEVADLVDLYPSLPYVSSREARRAGAPRFPRFAAWRSIKLGELTEGRLTARRHLNNVPPEAFEFYRNAATVRALSIPLVGAQGQESVTSLAHGVAGHMDDTVSRYNETVNGLNFVEGTPGAAYEEMVATVPRRGESGAFQSQGHGVDIVTDIVKGLDTAARTLDDMSLGLSGHPSEKAVRGARDVFDRASARLVRREVSDMVDYTTWKSSRGVEAAQGTEVLRPNARSGGDDMLRRTHRIIFDAWRSTAKLANTASELIPLRNALRDILGGDGTTAALRGEAAQSARNISTGTVQLDEIVALRAAGEGLSDVQNALYAQNKEQIDNLVRNRGLTGPDMPNIFGEAASARFRAMNEIYEAGHNALEAIDKDLAFRDMGFSGSNLVKRYEEDLVHSPEMITNPEQVRQLQENLESLERAMDMAEELVPGLRVAPDAAKQLSPEELSRFETIMAARGQHRQYLGKEQSLLGAIGNMMVAQTAGGLIGSLTPWPAAGWLMGMGAGVAAVTLRQMDQSPGTFLLYQAKIRERIVAYGRGLERGGAEIKQALTTHSRLRERVERYGRMPGRALGFRILTPDIPREERVEEYNVLRERLVNLYNDPIMMAEELEMSFAPMERVNPNVAASMRSTVIQGAYYLASNMPPPEYDPLVAGRVAVQPNMAEIDSFVARFRAIQDPLSIMTDLARGQLRHESAEAVRMVYPNVMADITATVGMVVEEMGDDVRNIPYQMRVNMDLLIGSPTDTTLKGGFIEAMQSRFAQTPQQSQAQGMSRARPRSIRIASSYLTEGQALGQGN
jgi:hypothetical protein